MKNLKRQMPTIPEEAQAGFNNYYIPERRFQERYLVHTQNPYHMSYKYYDHHTLPIQRCPREILEEKYHKRIKHNPEVQFRPFLFVQKNPEKTEEDKLDKPLSVLIKAVDQEAYQSPTFYKMPTEEAIYKENYRLKTQNKDLRIMLRQKQQLLQKQNQNIQLLNSLYNPDQLDILRKENQQFKQHFQALSLKLRQAQQKTTNYKNELDSLKQSEHQTIIHYHELQEIIEKGCNNCLILKDNLLELHSENVKLKRRIDIMTSELTIKSSKLNDVDKQRKLASLKEDYKIYGPFNNSQLMVQ